jgi:predicted transposase/invertase (TIGR01784 family)
MKKISPTNDLIFRKTFASKGNEDILAGLAKDFFSLEPRKITINNPYSIESYYKIVADKKELSARETIKDISASFEMEDFICEMQVDKISDYHARALYYALSAYTANYGRENAMQSYPNGKPNKYSSLRSVYALNFLGYNYYDDKNPYRIYQLYDAENKKPHEPKNIFIAYFEYRKVNNFLTPLKHWNDYINERPISPDAPDYIKKAVDLMNYINLSEEERRMIDAAERWEDEVDARIANSYYEGETKGVKIGREEGRKEGREEGEKRKAIKTTLKLLEFGISIEKIAEAVDFPVETIIKIQRGEIFDI